MRKITSADIGCLGNPVIVFTLGRSGTHMTIDLIRRHFSSFSSWKYPGELNSSVYSWLDALTHPTQAPRALRRARGAQRSIFMTHYWPVVQARLVHDHPEVALWLAERGHVVHVIRNPRHAISSAWPIENERARRGLQAVPQVEDYIERVGRRWAADIEFMRNEPQHLMLRFEDLLREPEKGVERLGQYLGEIPLWRKPVFATPHPTTTSARFSRLFKIRPASTASVVSRIVKRRYTLRWTRDLNSILINATGETLSELGYFDFAEDNTAVIKPTAPGDGSFIRGISTAVPF